MESGFCKIKTPEESLVLSNQIIADLGCPAANPLSCLLGKTVAQIAAVTKVNTYFPTLHPYEMSEQPYQLVEKGTYNMVPLIAGINHDETSMWFCPRFADINETQYQQIVNSCYGTTLGPLLTQFYQASKYANPNAALIAMTSDSVFKCPTKQLAELVSQSGKADSFVYSFDHAPSDKCHGAEHSNELAFIWWSTSMTGQDRNLSQIMRGAWTSFSAAGVPSFPAPIQSLQWKKYDNTTAPFISFNYATTANQGFLGNDCQFWDDLQTKFPTLDLHQTSVNCLYA
jgi:para-nitrobenzyl esterase